MIFDLTNCFDLTNGFVGLNQFAKSRFNCTNNNNNKIFFPKESTSLSMGQAYCPQIAQIVYYLTIAIINRHFTFQNDWLKIIWHTVLPYTALLKKSKISNNNGTSWVICSKIKSTPVYVKIQINVKLHAIPFTTFCLSAATKFVSHRDKHFVKLVKSCSGYPKTCKSIKNRKSKIFVIPIFSSCTLYKRK